MKLKKKETEEMKRMEMPKKQRKSNGEKSMSLKNREHSLSNISVVLLAASGYCVVVRGAHKPKAKTIPRYPVVAVRDEMGNVVVARKRKERKTQREREEEHKRMMEEMVELLEGQKSKEIEVSRTRRGKKNILIRVGRTLITRDTIEEVGLVIQEILKKELEGVGKTQEKEIKGIGIEAVEEAIARTTCAVVGSKESRGGMFDTKDNN